MHGRLGNTAETFGVLVFSNGGENADKTDFSFTAGPARRSRIVELVSWQTHMYVVVYGRCSVHTPYIGIQPAAPLQTQRPRSFTNANPDSYYFRREQAVCRMPGIL